MRITDIFPLGIAALLSAFILTLVACLRQKRPFRQALRLFAARFGGLWYALVTITIAIKSKLRRKSQ